MKPEGVSTLQWYKYNFFYLAEHIIGQKYSKKYLLPSKMKLFHKAMENQDIRSRAETIPTQEIEYDSFEAYKSSKKNLLESPLVFRGVAKEWPCCQKWSKDFFKERYGNVRVTLINNPGLVDKNEKNEFKVTDFSGYFDEAEKDKSKYLRFSRILDNQKDLVDDLNYDWLRQFKTPFSGHEVSYLFIGEGNTKTPTHAGLPHTLFIQVKGRKRWVVMAPNERFFLDPVADRTLYFYTNSDIRNNEDERYPLVPFIRKYEFVLDEGDVMWMPGLFWHHVENETPTIGVAFKYQNLPEVFKLSKAMFFLAFTATKPTIFRSFIYNILNKQDYIYNNES